MFLIVSKYLVPKGYSGIAVFPFVFFRSENQAGDVVSVNHERIHLRQQAELLVVLFFVWYGIEFLVRLAKHGTLNSAYRNISFEREAYANESNLTYLKHRPFWRFLNYL